MGAIYSGKKFWAELWLLCLYMAVLGGLSSHALLGSRVGLSAIHIPLDICHLEDIVVVRKYNRQMRCLE